MDFVKTLFTIPDDLRRLYRQLETMEKKLIRALWSKTFNEVCVKENIMPDYTRIRLHDPAVADTTDTMDYRRYLIERQIQEKDKHITRLNRLRDNLKHDIDRYELANSLKDPVQKAQKAK